MLNLWKLHENPKTALLGPAPAGFKAGLQMNAWLKLPMGEAALAAAVASVDFDAMQQTLEDAGFNSRDGRHRIARRGRRFWQATRRRFGSACRFPSRCISS